MSASRITFLALVLSASLAHAQDADGGVPDGGVPDGGAAVAVVESPAVALKTARDEFDFGNYERVVGRLRPIVEALELSRELPEKADRLEALRVYGIACTLTGRRTAAEGAFLLLLREEPSTRLDPAFVRPEAVAYFEEVRSRHRAELLAAYRKNRRPYYWALDLIPLAGQLQNRQWRKAIAFGAIDLVLLGTNITTGVLLDRYAGSDGSFRHHPGVYGPLSGVNFASFGLLLGVAAGGIIDAFVVGVRRRDRDREAEARLGF